MTGQDALEKDGAGCATNDVLGDATQQHAVEARAPVRGYGDEIGVQLTGPAENDLAGRALRAFNVSGESLSLQLLLQGREVARSLIGAGPVLCRPGRG